MVNIKEVFLDFNPKIMILPPIIRYFEEKNE